ncbi:uncharacterized protein BJX67DRAFT_380127 [Aspergillus lucknowensis]|uniref:Uncharacterized protein n=1 Tax=Aspergillus lucknowensis TaxID=176173 RepID=A0ABR4LY66_9EURO
MSQDTGLFSIKRPREVNLVSSTPAPQIGVKLWQVRGLTAMCPDTGKRAKLLFSTPTLVGPEAHQFDWRIPKSTVYLPTHAFNVNFKLCQPSPTAKLSAIILWGLWD